MKSLKIESYLVKAKFCRDSMSHKTTGGTNEVRAAHILTSSWQPISLLRIASSILKICIQLQQSSKEERIILPLKCWASDIISGYMSHTLLIKLCNTVCKTSLVRNLLPLWESYKTSRWYSKHWIKQIKNKHLIVCGVHSIFFDRWNFYQ